MCWQVPTQPVSALEKLRNATPCETVSSSMNTTRRKRRKSVVGIWLCQARLSWRHYSNLKPWRTIKCLSLFLCLSLAFWLFAWKIGFSHDLSFFLLPGLKRKLNSLCNIGDGLKKTSLSEKSHCVGSMDWFGRGGLLAVNSSHVLSRVTSKQAPSCVAT